MEKNREIKNRPPTYSQSLTKEQRQLNGVSSLFNR